jgi:hypothetical protein
MFVGRYISTLFSVTCAWSSKTKRARKQMTASNQGCVLKLCHLMISKLPTSKCRLPNCRPSKCQLPNCWHRVVNFQLADFELLTSSLPTIKMSTSKLPTVKMLTSKLPTLKCQLPPCQPSKCQLPSCQPSKCQLPTCRLVSAFVARVEIMVRAIQLITFIGWESNQH